MQTQPLRMRRDYGVSKEKQDEDVYLSCEKRKSVAREILKVARILSGKKFSRKD
jgi:hypothetical protein